MSDEITTVPRFSPLTALLTGVLASATYYVVSTLVWGVQYWWMRRDFDLDSETGEFYDEDQSFAAGLGFTDAVDYVVAATMLLAGLGALLILWRSGRFSRLTLTTFTVGVALAPLVGFLVTDAVFGLLGRS